MKKTFFLSTLCLVIFSCNNSSAPGSQISTSDNATDTGSTKKSQPVEIADMKYMDIGKAGIQQLASSDIDGWMGSFADNAVYLWSAGDSLAGKKAISDYWKNRLTKIIDSLSITNDIWLPIKVNQSQRGPDMPGIWLMGWYQFNTKYKNGQRVIGWIHVDMHFDNNDKIDRLIQYIDRAPITAALSKK